MDWSAVWHDLQYAVASFAVAAFALVALSVLASPRAGTVRGLLRRLAELPTCERGSVQGLSFVITLPLYVMIVLFIIQVGLLMQAVVVVHYSAFATARTASVWLPAAVDAAGYPSERANSVAPGLTAVTPVVVKLAPAAPAPGTSLKFVKIAQAAVMSCAAISPSGDYGFGADEETGRLANATTALYAALTPEIQRNPRQANRLQRKLAYAAANTFVQVAFTDHDSPQGPTYNPRDIVVVPAVMDLWRLQNRGPWLNLPRLVSPGDVVLPGPSLRSFVPNEVGWEDTITVRVTHFFALLPGPGRFLARQIAGNAAADPVADRITASVAPNGRPLYTVPLSASAVISCEGLQPVLYVPLP